MTSVMSSLRMVSPKKLAASVTTASRISPGSRAAARRTDARNRFSPYSSPVELSHSTMPSVYQTRMSPGRSSVVLVSYFDSLRSPRRLIVSEEVSV